MPLSLCAKVMQLYRKLISNLKMVATDTLVNWISPRNRVSPIVLRVNAKILERNPVSQPRDNLNLYYDGKNYL